ncbi:hypothetical protein predicted by Glimmer/Critica [Streptococcus dysgalactiae subsp. equisimilis AC-2713]|uniref:Uncharacterized protein n=1 Tax=Streptococcus dysgalactiae subsp. equisimilis AC-2713 TaxID=759913 RepID=A0AB33R6D8_STREQ|nr:hypothetical protein [Streptococcus dysgalactiae]CCI63036.1 hypothetical protein predicted by Glimmer/Critica [Streptococcus dysgalactiae subsp. equisimilis AC-2713]
MEHILVLPEELNIKLQNAYIQQTTINEWQNIGINSVSDLLVRVIEQLNNNDSKLNLKKYRFEDKKIIKNRLNNLGNTSIYSGFIEDMKGNILGLIFYIEPNTSSGNDLVTRNIWPTLIGIQESFSDQKIDLYFTSRPVYIVNLNETTRSLQNAFKILVLCYIILNFKYIDIFNRPFVDVIPNYNNFSNSIEAFKSLTSLDNYSNLLSVLGVNDYFTYDTNKKILKVLPDRLKLRGANPSAEVYRYYSKVLPACYIAKNEGYIIDFTELYGIRISGVITLKKYLNKLNN